MRKCTQHSAWHLVNVQYMAIIVSLNHPLSFLSGLDAATLLVCQVQHKSSPLPLAFPYSRNFCPQRLESLAAFHFQIGVNATSAHFLFLTLPLLPLTHNL